MLKLIYIIIILLFVTYPQVLKKTEFPIFRVVLDPGHGGLYFTNRKQHGDRFDTLTGKYLQDYKDGCSYRKLEEHAIAYSIARKVKNILDLASPGGDFSKFSGILKRFTDDNPGRVFILSKLSREDSRNRQKLFKRNDSNAQFRLFDYPDKYGNLAPGRISKINSFKPHLVVSLHLDTRPPVYYRGINPVIVAPFSRLLNGLLYKQGKIKKNNFFYRNPYSNWYVESVKRTEFSWFLKDASVYFTGYPINKSGKIIQKDFMGYNYNMVSWAYKDPEGWEKIALKHPKKTRYANTHKEFSASGTFWDRERSKFEKYRRDGGEEGFGGDNLYASTEIIRYILFSLDLNGIRHKRQKLGNPYISTWALPLLVNAIAAYIELGYLALKRDRYLLTKKQDEIAEGIAAGIYSLLAGLKPKSQQFKYLPRGKRVDLKKYLVTPEKNYFEIVVQE